MATRRIKCEGSLFMESVFAKMQEIYTHTLSSLVTTANS